MGWISIIVILLIIVFVFLVRITSSKDILYNGDIEYLGGFKDVTGGKKVWTTITEKGISFQFKNNEKYISFQNVQECSIVQEQQLQQQIGLGKVLVFGLLSLGMKTSKTVVDNYIMITQKNNECIILKGMNDKLSENIIKIVNSKLN